MTYEVNLHKERVEVNGGVSAHANPAGRFLFNIRMRSPHLGSSRPPPLSISLDVNVSRHSVSLTGYRGHSYSTLGYFPIIV